MSVPTLVTRPRVAQALWSVAAQGLSSGSNVGVQVGLLLTMAPAPFGGIVVGLSVYYLALALGRALVGDPLVALATSEADVDRRWPAARRRLLGLGSAAVVMMLALAVVVEPVRAELVILAASLPVLLLQDGHRYRCWARRRPDLVVALDGAWFLTSGVALGLALTVGEPGAATDRIVLAAWVLGAAVSWQLGRRLAGVDRPDPIIGTGGGPVVVGDGGILNDRTASSSLARSQAILALDANGLPAAVAAAAGATVTAGLRAAVLPFAPMTSVLGGLRVIILPVLRAGVVAGHARATIAKVVGLYGAATISLAGLTVIAVGAMPGTWLGETGRLVRPLVALAAVVVTGRLVGLPLADLLSLGADHRRAATLRLVTSALDWSATLLGAVAFGIEGAIAGRAVAAVGSLTIWWIAVAAATAGGAVERPEGTPAVAGR